MSSNLMGSRGDLPVRWQVVGVRCGVMPPLAAGFIARPESAPALVQAVAPGSVLALVNAEPGTGACGKTQLAIHVAESLWRAGRVDLLAWVDASSRGSLLAAYMQGAAAMGIEPVGPAEHVAGRFAGWLAATTRPWLLVLDDLREAGHLSGLWPSGPMGTVLITSRDRESLDGTPDELRIHEVPLAGGHRCGPRDRP
jgi:hypothetical protein